MCKINGHSIFTYWAQPWNTAKLYTDNARRKETNAALARQAEAEKAANAAIEGDDLSQTAKTAQVNKTKKNQSLSSLRTPLEAQDVGASVGNTSLGLNLGG